MVDALCREADVTKRSEVLVKELTAAQKTVELHASSIGLLQEEYDSLNDALHGKTDTLILTQAAAEEMKQENERLRETIEALRSELSELRATSLYCESSDRLTLMPEEVPSTCNETKSPPDLLAGPSFDTLSCEGPSPRLSVENLQSCHLCVSLLACMELNRTNWVL